MSTRRAARLSVLTLSSEMPDDGTRLLTRQQALRLFRRGGAGLLAFAASRLFSAAALAETAATAPARSTTGADDRPLEAQEIADGVFVHQGQHGVYAPANGGDICNTGFIIGNDAVAVVDTGGTARLGAALKAQIRKHTARPIRYVINTHMHPDHVLGNAAFNDGTAVFVGHEKLAAALSARAERYLAYNKAAVGADAFAGTEIVLPGETVDTVRDIDLGGRTLRLSARPTAHTDNDLTVYDSASGTLFTGDLVFAGHVPTLDGSIRGWLRLLDELAGETARRIVPGHGPAAMEWPGAAQPIRRYLETVAAGVRQAIRDGSTLSEAVETVGLSERGHWQLFEEFHRRNVSAAFAELEWE